jgi:hypothetical protein
MVVPTPRSDRQLSSLSSSVGIAQEKVANDCAVGTIFYEYIVPEFGLKRFFFKIPDFFLS